MAEGMVPIRTVQEGHFLHMWRGRGALMPPCRLRHMLRQMERICVLGHRPGGTPLPPLPEGTPLPPLPEGLGPSAGRSGVIGLCSMTDARGLAPFRLPFGGIAVRETHAPRTAPKPPLCAAASRTVRPPISCPASSARTASGPE